MIAVFATDVGANADTNICSCVVVIVLVQGTPLLLPQLRALTASVARQSHPQGLSSLDQPLAMRRGPCLATIPHNWNCHPPPSCCNSSLAATPCQLLLSSLLLPQPPPPCPISRLIDIICCCCLLDQCGCCHCLPTLTNLPTGAVESRGKEDTLASIALVLLQHPCRELKNGQS